MAFESLMSFVVAVAVPVWLIVEHFTWTERRRVANAQRRPSPRAAVPASRAA